MLVAFDIAGLGLVGVTVSILSGTKVSEDSVTGRAISALTTLGISNPYAIFAAGSVTFFLVKALLAVWLNKFVLNQVAKLESRKASETFYSLARTNLHILDRHPKIELSKVLQEGFELAIGKLIMGLSVIFGELTLILGVSVYLVTVHWQLFLVFSFFFATLGFFLSALVSKRTRQAAVDIHDANLGVQRVVHDLFDNFRQLKTVGRQDFLVAQFRSYRWVMADAGAKMSNLSVLPRYITEVALMIGFSLLILQRSLLGENALEAAIVAVFIAGAFRILASMLPLQGSVTMLRQIAANTTQTIEVTRDLDGSHVAAESPMDQFAAKPVNFDISIANLSFKFPDSRTPILSHLNIQIRQGDYVVVTGRSGSGKSTLADLLLGLRFSTGGEITIAGFPPEQIVERFPGSIAYVPQRCFLMDGTLAENVCLVQNPSREEKESAANILEELGLGELMATLPLGIDTTIGASSRNLSGGQLQRLGIARALYVRPQILILDEATGALDNHSESEVLSALDKLRGTTTIIAIAHKGKAISHADFSLELRNGKMTLAPRRVANELDS